MKRIRFSLANMLLLTAIVALTIALVCSRLEVLQLTNELKNVAPLREVEVYAQIERQTAAAKTPVAVTSSTYTGSTYLINYV